MKALSLTLFSLLLATAISGCTSKPEGDKSKAPGDGAVEKKPPPDPAKVKMQ